MGSGRVPEIWDLGEYQKGRIRASTGNVEIRASTENDRIRASTGNVKIRASTRNGRNPGEYRK